MTNITYDQAAVRVRFPGWESRMTGTAEVVIPRSSIRGVAVRPDWTSEILGLRSGLAISGFRKLGTFIHPRGTRRLVSMRRGSPLLRIAVARASVGFDEILVSTPEAESIATALRDPEGQA